MDPAFVQAPTTAHLAAKASAFTCAAVPQVSAPTAGQPSRRAAAVSMNLWKDLFSGGFPGGEAFFRSWVEQGMTGEVPDLSRDKQPFSPPNKPVEVEEEKKKPEAFDDPTKWKDENLAAGGFPGGEAFFRLWVEEGFVRPVPGTGFNGVNAAPSYSKKSSGAAVSGGVSVKKPLVTVNAAVAVPVVDWAAVPAAPAAPAYIPPPPPKPMPPPVGTKEKVTTVLGRNGLPITIRVPDEPKTVEGIINKYYPEKVRNKAPVITINYGKGQKNVGLAMQEIKGMEVDPKSMLKPKAAPAAGLGAQYSKSGAKKLVFDVDPYSNPDAKNQFQNKFSKK